MRGTHVHCVFYHVSGDYFDVRTQVFRHVILSHWKKKITFKTMTMQSKYSVLWGEYVLNMDVLRKVSFFLGEKNCV